MCLRWHTPRRLPRLLRLSQRGRHTRRRRRGCFHPPKRKARPEMLRPAAASAFNTHILYAIIYIYRLQYIHRHTRRNTKGSHLHPRKKRPEKLQTAAQDMFNVHVLNTGNEKDYVKTIIAKKTSRSQKVTFDNEKNYGRKSYKYK